MDDIVFPEYEFTFEVVSIHFDIAQFNVLYKPVDSRLTHLEYSLPILPTMEVNNLYPYVKQFAPYSVWYAQEVLLNNSETLLGTKG
jgi:uncharacterized protein (DUF486 family)